LRRLHVSIHDKEIPIWHETGKPDVLAGGLDLDLAKDVEKELEELGIRTVDICTGEGYGLENINIWIVIARKKKKKKNIPRSRAL
jgi:hypothetical protein